MDELVNEIIAELKTELENQPTFNADILANKVKGAYRKVRSRKCYENTSYSEEQINENSISRTWRTEDEILGNIVAFVGMF